MKCFIVILPIDLCKSFLFNSGMKGGNVKSDHLVTQKFPQSCVVCLLVKAVFRGKHFSTLNSVELSLIINHSDHCSTLQVTLLRSTLGYLKECDLGFEFNYLFPFFFFFKNFLLVRAGVIAYQQDVCLACKDIPKGYTQRYTQRANLSLRSVVSAYEIENQKFDLLM